MVPAFSQPRRVLPLVTLATLAVFGGLVATLTWRLRAELREEVLRREAEAVHAVALMQLQLAEERSGARGLEDAFEAVLESSKLRGVLAVHVFTPGGDLFAALPVTPGERRWRDGGGVPAQPRARFAPRASLEAALGLPVEPGAEPTRAALIETIVPLRTAADTLGFARYWSDGETVAREFARIDRRLLRQAGIAFLGGAALIAVLLGWAFARLGEAHRRLEEQRADLARANEELDFAAKTGALGAISAHLIHGLKNPLAGLEGFVAETATGAPEALRGEACRTAIETAQRLRALVTEVTTVLRDEAHGEADYAVPVREVVEAARLRAAAMAEAAAVTLAADANAEAFVGARTANLAGLVLANLVANAIEAVPRGGRVTVEASAAEGRVEFFVRDSGGGLPDEVRRTLFRPVRSAKPGGGGVGLAISHRLAKHAGGDLELVRSDPSGSVFRLSAPAVAAPVNASSSARR